MIHHLSARKLSHQFTHNQLSAEQITNHFLNRIRQQDQDVGAFLSVFYDQALERARFLDEKRKSGKKLGKLAGIPIALKDNIHVNKELTTCGSKFLSNYRAVFDATVTELLLKEDAIIIGKTNLDEFAMGSSTENSAFRQTSNPWNLDYVPGGSSGGSAAAVAARFCPLALGSDTGGSVRQPAGLCGVVGFKPSYGRVSRYGLVAFASSLDQIGPLATSSEDISLIMEVIGAHDPKDATSNTEPSGHYLSRLDEPLRGKKVGIPVEFLKDLSAETRASFNQSLEILKDLGCEIVEVDLNLLHTSVATYYVIATAEASTNLARFDGIRYGVRAQGETLEEVYQNSRGQGFGPEVKRRILLGTYVLSSGFQDAYYRQAAKVRSKIINTFDLAFERCDLIATPVSPIAAFKRGEIQDPVQMYLQDIYTIGVNLAYLPAISTPCGYSQNGLPLGLQLIGPKRSDPLVCLSAHQFEKKAQMIKCPPAFNK